jgi:hypothetical protein
MSKMVFHNTGTRPVTDFSISYQINGYLDWTTPEVVPQILPSQTIVKCFYPQFPAKVTEIKNTTPSALEARIRWNDGTGPREEVVHTDFQFRGVNEIEYTDMPQNEIINWRDLFASSELVAAMVTPNDPVVAEYAAAITGRIGGAVAGAGGDKEKIEIMGAIYDYMLETGMRYAGSEGTAEKIGDAETTIQTVRLPRDVILSNNGLCLELTLVWASVLEHLGIRSYVWLIPGHAFIVVPLQHPINGLPYLPIECTAITPKAVGYENLRGITFVQAYTLACDTLIKSYNAHKYIPINAAALHDAGIQPPELPGVNLDEIKHIIASRRAMTIRVMSNRR